MKKLTCGLVLLIITIPSVQAVEKPWYVSFGFSSFVENESSGVGEGIGIPLAIGRDINNLFGVEFQIDVAPSADEFSYVERIDADLFAQATSYEVDSPGILYTSLSGKYSRPLNNTFNLVLKVGLAYFDDWADVSVETENGQTTTASVFNDKGRISVFSVGVEFARDQNWNSPISLAFTQYFGSVHDASNFSVGLKFKW